MRHAIRMLIGCLLPIVVIFWLPLFGISEDVSLLLAIVLMFGCHLLMMRGYYHAASHRGGRDD